MWCDVMYFFVWGVGYNFANYTFNNKLVFNSALESRPSGNIARVCFTFGKYKYITKKPRNIDTSVNKLAQTHLKKLHKISMRNNVVLFCDSSC